MMGFVVLGLLGMAAAGCSTTAGRCEDMCQWLDDCGTDPASNCKSECESDYDDATDGCQDAFDEFADCLSENDLSCSKVDKSCDGSAAKFLVECGDE